MGAYKQFLASDIIVAPLQVHKGFTFSNLTTLSLINNRNGTPVEVSTNWFGGSNSSYPGVAINRLLGRNVSYFDFDPNIDPITGNYLIITAGLKSTYNSLSITPFHNQASSIRSSSFNLNGTNIVLTGSSGGINLINTIFVPSGSNDISSATDIVSHINNSSSIYFNINNIGATNSGTSQIIFTSKTREYINNFYYIISGSVTSYFTGGANDIATGYEYQRLIYNSIKELYYSNYQTSIYSDHVSRPILVPGRDEAGNRYIGSSSNQAYDNYLQTTLTYPRFFPTASGATIGVLSIPNTLFGDYIQPGSIEISFPYQSTTLTFTDDGEGNLLLNNQYFGTSSAIVGNVIYPHGIITLTGNETMYSYLNSGSNAGLSSAVYSSSIYSGSYVYGDVLDLRQVVSNFVSSSDFTCSFSSSYTIYETQYKCTIRENEFNFTLNPSALLGSYNTGSKSGILNDNITGSYFDPYITTIGLYDEQQNLLAIGKLAQPLPSSPTTDTTILINIDR